MTNLNKYSYLDNHISEFITSNENKYKNFASDELDIELSNLISENITIHEKEGINLNPATNIMNPKAEKALASGLGTRASLGNPGDKYEMGLEAIEKIEIIANMLICEIFNSKYAELRVASGAMANLYAFMACCKPGDKIITPPPSIGGHVTHHEAGAAGLYGLEIHHGKVDKENFTYDLDALDVQVKKLNPKLITIGGSLNYFPHPVAKVKKIAEKYNCYLLFDAAHLSGIFAGKAWPIPLDEGADIMSFSTYKSLGGPPSGAIVTNNKDLAAKLNHIAFPGLTANFDAAKTTSLAIAMLDWKEYGEAYVSMMIKNAKKLAIELENLNIPVFKTSNGHTRSHQIAIESKTFGGGQNASKHLRCVNLLACGIGLPIETVPGDLNGIRLGTPEITRFGMKEDEMEVLAKLVADTLNNKRELSEIKKDVISLSKNFSNLHYIRN